MTGVCPRCQSQLAGPVCARCGARFDVPPGAPPVSAYPPPPPMPFPGAYGAPYMMYQPGAPVARGKGMAVPGGIMSIITGVIVLLITIAAFSRANYRGHGDILAVMVTCFVLGATAIVFGVYALGARWWACLVAGLTMTLTTLVGFLWIAVAVSLKEKRYRSWDYDYNYRDTHVDGLTYDDIETLAAIGGGFILLAVVALIAGIFCFIGISSSKAYLQYRKHLEATQQF